jgi:hypothetical protein
VILNETSYTEHLMQCQIPRKPSEWVNDIMIPVILTHIMEATVLFLIECDIVKSRPAP